MDHAWEWNAKRGTLSSDCYIRRRNDFTTPYFPTKVSCRPLSPLALPREPAYLSFACVWMGHWVVNRNLAKVWADYSAIYWSRVSSVGWGIVQRRSIHSWLHQIAWIVNSTIRLWSSLISANYTKWIVQQWNGLWTHWSNVPKRGQKQNMTDRHRIRRFHLEIDIDLVLSRMQDIFRRARIA